MFCRHCGKQVNDTDLFCCSCGGSLRAEPQQIQEEPQPHSQQAPAQEEFTASFYAAPTDTYTPPAQSYTQQPYTQQSYTPPVYSDYQQSTRREEEPKAPVSPLESERATKTLTLGIVSVALLFVSLIFSEGYLILTEPMEYVIASMMALMFSLPSFIVGRIAKTEANGIEFEFHRLTPKARIGKIFGTVGGIAGIVLAALSLLLVLLALLTLSL